MDFRELDVPHTGKYKMLKVMEIVVLERYLHVLVGVVALIRYWLTTEMGIMVASKYNVKLHMLSMQGSSKFLPLRSYPPLWHQHTYIAIGFVNNGHYVKVTLNEGYPMPGITPQWNYFKYGHASGWATPYETRINTYMKYVHSEHIPDRIILDP